MRKILILPWGSPWGWKTVKYAYEGNSLLSKTTLPLLYEVINPDRAVIIALDSLAKQGENYREIKHNARTDILHFLCLNSPQVPNEKVEVVISYSVGKFRNAPFSFDRDLSDFYPHILWELGKHIWDVAKGSDKVEIYLDLTHGLNFMPTLVYRAVRKLGSILSLTKDVRLVVLNSEPFHTEGQESHIHTVSDVYLRPYFLIRRIAEDIGDDGSNTEFLVDRNDNNNGISAKALGFPNITELDAFSASVQNGFPVGIFHFFPDTITLERAIISTFRAYESKTKLDREEVRAKYRFEGKFSNVLQVYFLSKVISEKIPDYGDQWNFKGDGVKWEDVKNLVKEIYENKLERLNAIIKQQIDKTDKVIKSYENEWKSLFTACSNRVWIPQIYDGENRFNKDKNSAYKKLKDFSCSCVNDQKQNRKPSVMKRHFIAHSGLIHGTYMVSVRNNEIYVRYCDKVEIREEKNPNKLLKDYNITRLIQETLEE